MAYEWDEEKAEANRLKHGLRFEVAIRAFDDPCALYEYNSEKDGEERFHVIGLVDAVIVALVVFTTRRQEEGNEEIYRIISARKATPRERRLYEAALN